MRGGSEMELIDIANNEEIINFIFGTIIGRVSNLSALIYFHENMDSVKNLVTDISAFDYIIEFFKPIWGGVLNFSYNGYTTILTNFYDPSAFNDYGIMYGLNTVVILSYYKSVYVLLLNSLFFLIVLFTLIYLSKQLFNLYYKEVLLVSLFAPLSSGVPSELGNLFVSLIVLFIMKKIYIKIYKTKVIQL